MPAVSLSVMVNVLTAGAPSAAPPVGLLSVTTTVSGPSTRLSLTVGTVIVRLVSPAVNDRVPATTTV